MSELDLGTLRLLRETAMRIEESSLSGGRVTTVASLKPPEKVHVQ
jgi:hypothetical protein